MIHLTFFENSEGLLTGFSAEGHAGYAEEGEPDILCAAVTALTTGTMGALQDVVEIPISYVAEEGNIRCDLQTQAQPERKREDALLLLRSLELACQQIQRTYGAQYLRIRHIKRS